MKVPLSLLPHELTVQPFKGSGAYGPVFDAPVTVRARVEGRRRTVKRGDGSEVISSAMATIRPEVEVPIESKATWEGRSYEVLDVLPLTGLKQTVGYELLLGAA